MNPRHRLPSRCGPALLVGAITTLLTSSPVTLAANTWDGGGANGHWSTLLNWDDDLLPNLANGLTFGGNTNVATTNDLTGLVVGGLNFDLTADGFVLGGNAITLHGNIISDSAGAQTIHLPMTLAAATTVNVASGTLTIGPGAGGSGVIAGNFGLTKTGFGSLTLGAVNTYTGDTILEGGTLAYTADNTVSNLIFGAAAVTPFSNTVSGLDLTNANLTASSLLVRVNSTGTNTITIGAGRTLTVNGAVTIGPNVNGIAAGPDANTVRTFLNVTGGGSLVVNSTANFVVGQFRANADPGGDPQATMDLSGLSNFTYQAGTSTGELRVGFGGNLASTMRLAAATNTITARLVQVGASNNQNNGGPSTLTLGGGTNVFNVNTFNIGAGKSAGNINFLGGTGSVTIAGQTTATADLTLGSASSATASTNISTMLLAGHEANIQAGTVIIGRLSGASGGQGSAQMTFDTGTFNIVNLQMAVHSSGTAPLGASGSFTVGGGILNVTNQFLLLNRTTANGTAAVSNFTLAGGTATIGSDILIVDNNTNGAATRSTTFALTGGTLNMTGHAIASAAFPIDTVFFPAFGQTATLMNLGGTGINGAGLTMTGDGILILEGNNTYSGPTTIAAGRVQVGTGGNTGTLGDGAVVNNGVLALHQSGTLTIAGAISGSGTLQQNGPGLVTLAGTNSYGGLTDINAGTLSVTGSLAGAVNVLTGGTLAGQGDGLTTGTVGDVTLAAGASIRPGATGSGGDTGTLTMSTLTVNGGDLQFDLGATSDLLHVTGAANFAAASTLTPNPATPAGTYTLLTAGNLVLGVNPALNAPIGTRKNFAADFGTPNAIKLIVTGASKTITWTGATNSVWDTGAGGTPNWNDGVAGETFFQADAVLFADGPVNRTVTLTGITVAPTSVTVNNSFGNDYTIGGTGAIGGTAALVKHGAGAVSLTGPNTYTGGTTLNAGTININHPTALGAATLTILGGALDNTSGAALTVTADNPQLWNGDFAFTGTHPLHLGAGPITLAGDRTVTVGASMLTIGGGIGGASTLIKAGAGTLVFTGPNTHAATNITAGVLQVGNGGTLGAGQVTNDAMLAFNHTEALTIPNLIGGTGMVTKAGGGVLTLSGTSFYDGPTLIQAGILKATNNFALGAVPGGPVMVAAGGTFDLGGNVTVNNVNFGQKQFHIAGNGAGGIGAITNSGAANQQNALQRVALTANASVGGSTRFDIRAPQAGGVNTAQLDLAGHTLTKNGPFLMSLVAVDVTDGNIVVNGGTFNIETTTSVPDFGTGTTITYHAGTNAQFFGTVAPSTILRPMIFNGSGIQIGNSSAGATSTVGSPMTLNGDVTLTALVQAAPAALTLAGNITEMGGARAITKTGNCVVILAGDNSYSGGTTINAGTLQVGSATALGAATAPLTINTGGTLDLFSSSLTVGALSGTNGTITSTGGGILTLTAGDTADTTFAGAIQENFSTLSLVKQGSGSLTLSGVSAYSGDTTIHAGTLVITGSLSGGLTPGNVLINGGALKGTGITGTVILNTGWLAPGITTGILTTGNLFAAGGTFGAEISGATPGTGAGFHDQLNVAGTVAFNAPVALTLDFSTYDPVDSVDSFTLIDNDGVDPVTFGDANSRLFFGASRLDEGTQFTATSGAFSQAFTITYAGGSGNDVVLTAVPEPGAATFLAGGLLLGAARRRRLKGSRDREVTG